MQKYFISDDDFKNNKITSDDAFHISNVMQKLGVNGRASAVVELIRLNEISIK